MNLRKILNDQIQRKEVEKKESRQNSRKKKRYTELSNPISNPINYGFDPNNKYVLQEVTKVSSRQKYQNR